MQWLEFLKLLGSSAAIAAFVTSIINFMQLRIQHQRLLEIEKFKQNVAIESYIYAKLHESWIQLINCPNVTFSTSKSLGQMAEELQTSMRETMNAFEIVSPFLTPQCNDEIRKTENETDTAFMNYFQSQTKDNFKDFYLKASAHQKIVKKNVFMELTKYLLPLKPSFETTEKNDARSIHDEPENRSSGE